MGAVPSPDLLRPRRSEDVHIGSGIQFPSSVGCNHLFNVHDPCGIHNTWGSISVSSSPGALRSRFFSPLLFSFCTEEFSRLDRRASSPLMYFSSLASTSAMLALGFFEMENIRSFDYTPSPAMKAVMANFSSGMSTFNDSALNL